MRHLNPQRFLRGLHRWKPRDCTYVAAQWRPAQGLVATVCATSSARPRILASHHLPDAEPTATNISTLAQALGAAQLPWVWLLGRDDYLLVVMDKPPLPAAEMNGGVAWALEPRIDFPPEQASVAWMDLPQPEPAHATSQIYAVASRRTTVDQARRLFDEAQVALEVVDIPETAQRNIAALIAHEDECLAMLSFEATGALLTFTWLGELYLNRFIVQPLHDIDRADDADRHRILIRLVGHYQQSLDFLARQYEFLRVSRLVVGPVPFAWDPVPTLARALPHAVESIDLSRWVDWSDSADTPGGSDQARLWGVLGAALRQESLRS